MATLNTIRAILKDAKFKEHSSKIRENLSLLFKDVSRLGDRIENLDKHFSLASKDLEEVKVSAKKVTGRADRMDSLNFEEINETEVDRSDHQRSKLNVIRS
jgi:DNA recombination protein RmuC